MSMVVLALDTTSRQGSSAVAVDGRVVLELVSDASLAQASRVPGELQALLTRAQLALRDVNAFAVAVGPGSFTGLRVGIATMQGLAFDAGKPLVGISALDALATIADELGERAPGPGHLRSSSSGAQAGPGLHLLTATWIDAWRGEVYAALYDGVTEIEVGYHVRACLQGRGLATEAGAACRDYARDVLEVDRLVAIIDPHNQPSQRVAENLGLVVARTSDNRGRWSSKRLIYAASL